MMKAKADSNQPLIVEAFRDMGCTVQHLHTIGKGCPDIVVGVDGVNLLVEIKDGSLSPSKKALTKDEQGWHKLWRGQVCIVEAVADVVYLVLAVRMKNLSVEGKGIPHREPCPDCGHPMRVYANRAWCINPECNHGVITLSDDETYVQSK